MTVSTTTFAPPKVVSGPSFVRWAADRLERMAAVERWVTATLQTRA
jgi:hypothetical protein